MTAVDDVVLRPSEKTVHRQVGRDLISSTSVLPQFYWLDPGRAYDTCVVYGPNGPFIDSNMVASSPAQQKQQPEPCAKAKHRQAETPPPPSS